MNLKYALYDMVVPGNGTNVKRKHARVVPQRTVDMEMICELVSQSSSFSAADVKGILAAFTQWIGMYLRSGNAVRLDGLGYFFPTVRSREWIDEEGEKRCRVRVDTVGFRSSTELKKRLRTATLEEVKRDARDYPKAQRRKRVLKYLESHSYINGRDYRLLNGCSLYMALNDLRELMEEGVIRRMGKGKQTLYVGSK